MYKSKLAIALIAATILTTAFLSTGLFNSANAKESSCKVDADKNTCIITAKKGDVEIDKLKIEINVKGGESFNSTGLETQIHNLEDSISNLQNQVNNINTTDNGITSLEITEDNDNSDNNNGDNGSGSNSSEVETIPPNETGVIPDNNGTN